MEIYRYIPTDSPEIKTFHAPGTVIDVSQKRFSSKRFYPRSDFKTFFLFQSEATRPNQLVTRMTGPLGSGKYKCEITVETPSFVTLHRSINVTVVGEFNTEDNFTHEVNALWLKWLSSVGIPSLCATKWSEYIIKYISESRIIMFTHCFYEVRM